MKSSFVLLIMGFFCFYSGVLAQNWAGMSKVEFSHYLKKVSEMNQKNNQKIQFTRLIFEDVSFTTPSTRDNGIYYRGEKNQFRSESAGITTIQNGKLKLSIDTIQKIVVISKSDSLALGIDVTANIPSLLKEIDTVFYMDGPKRLFQLVLNESNIYFSGLEFAIDPKSYQLVSSTIFYRPSNYFSEHMEDETIENPKIVIEYSPFAPLSKSVALFSFSKWVIEEKNGDFTLQSLYSDYELIDTRFK